MMAQAHRTMARKRLRLIIDDLDTILLGELTIIMEISPRSLQSLSRPRKVTNLFCLTPPPVAMLSDGDLTETLLPKSGPRKRLKRTGIPLQKGPRRDSLKVANPDAEERARSAYIRKDYPAALKSFSAAIARNKSNEKLYANRSATNIALQSYERALKDAETCIRLAPGWWKGYYRKGVALENLLLYQEAALAFQDAERYDPENMTCAKALSRIESLLRERQAIDEETYEEVNDGRFTRLVKWMVNGGCRFSKLHLRYDSNRTRGVHTMCSIPDSSDCVLFVPRKFMMTNEVAQKSKIGRSIIESGYDMRSEHSWLAAYLLQEKHDPNSFWKPYIDVLPGDYSNMPILFDDFYKKLLKGSYALQSAQNTMESLRAEYDGICNVCPEFRKYLFMEYIWGRLAVSTRVFGVTIDGKKTSALVPFADMSNHSANSQTDWQFDSKRDGFTMVANRPIKRGDQIYVNYGRKCNGRYFVNYGFTVDGNQNDNDAVFVADLPVEDQHYALKMKMVNRAYLNREFQVPATYSCDVSVLSENMKPHNMFTYFRILHAQDKELLVFSSKEFKENMKEMEPISTRNEIEVLKHLRRIAQERLSEFPDPIEVDHKLLKENKFMDSNHRNCVMMRCGEKETYRWYIALADKAIPLLQMTWNLKFKRLAANFWGVSSRFAHYITHVVVPLVKASKK